MISLLKKISVHLFFLACLLTQSAHSSRGILFLSHGSMQDMTCSQTKLTRWEQTIMDQVVELRPHTEYAIEVAYGMWNTKCANIAISRLENKLAASGNELTDLHVIPLFISNHSYVIKMQKYMFKQVDTPPLDWGIKQVNFEQNIFYHSALGYDPALSLILLKRAHQLIHMAKAAGAKKGSDIELILIMHGPILDEDNVFWMEMAQSFLSDIQAIFPLGRLSAVSLRDDAADEVKQKATLDLRSKVESAKANGKKAIILPLLLSPGGIEYGIKSRLEGLDYIWKGDMLLPDAHFQKYLRMRVDKL